MIRRLLDKLFGRRLQPARVTVPVYRYVEVEQGRGVELRPGERVVGYWYGGVVTECWI